MVFGVCLFWVSFNNNLVGVRLITRFYWLSDNFGCLIGLFSVFGAVTVNLEGAPALYTHLAHLVYAAQEDSVVLVFS